MFFDDIDEILENPEFFHVVRREFFSVDVRFDSSPRTLRSVPTHTEDGIPIRKLYVGNLPPKTTRGDLFGIFAQYGFIRSCWMRIADRGMRTSVPTYAFVTYSDPADAHKALKAPIEEKILRGRTLRISPADSWHQPLEAKEIKLRWKPKTCQSRETKHYLRTDTQWDQNTENMDTSCSSDSINTCSNEKLDSESNDAETPNILNVLNRDCLHYILNYVPLRDLILTENVSKAWQCAIQEYLGSIRVYKTSWWQHGTKLTTAVLRRLLQRLAGLVRLHIDHHWSALNDRAAHAVGKFCPNLEEFLVIGMHTKNWNPLLYGCTLLKNMSFISCNKITDAGLQQAFKENSEIQSFTIANNTHITGLFLTGATTKKLKSLSFYSCYTLQGTVLCSALDNLPALRCLKLDMCPFTMWKVIPILLKKLPHLEELSLSEYTSVEDGPTPVGNDAFCEALSTMSQLKVLNLSRNIYITDSVMKQLGQSCRKLESLNISSCNGKRGFPYLPVEGPPMYPGVSEEGVAAVCAGCAALRHLDLSYLAALGDAGVAHAARLPRLRSLHARGLPAITARSLATVVSACTDLQELDVCGCDCVSDQLVEAAARALVARPRRLQLMLAGTAVEPTAHELILNKSTFPEHKLLIVNYTEDRCVKHLRPDFADRLNDDSSDQSAVDIFDDHDDYDDFEFDNDEDDDDDDLFLYDDELEDYEAIYDYGFNDPVILL